MKEHYIDFSKLLGKTLTKVEGCTNGSDVVTFTCDDGTEFQLWHQQDCCESVSLEDVCGEPSDLVGSTILQAEENYSGDEPADRIFSESHTWTFYRIATMKGQVVLRWLGESNGYYSESVTFSQVK